MADVAAGFHDQDGPVSHRAGAGRRRRGDQRAGDPCRFIPARETRPGLCDLSGAVVVAPVVGPTLGGWITDTCSWHWVFLINDPMGLSSLALVGTLVGEPSGAEQERKQFPKDGLRIDYVGFVLIAVGLGSLEFMLDEGQKNDWFGSNMILGFALTSAFCLLALIMKPIDLGAAPEGH